MSGPWLILLLGCATPPVPAPPPSSPPVLVVSRVIPGERMHIGVSGEDVLPGDAVHVLVSARGRQSPGAAGACAPAGAPCSGLVRPHHLGTVTADAIGEAGLWVDVPMSLSPGTPVWFEAMSEDAVSSPVEATVTSEYLPLVTGRLESAGPVRQCGDVVQWDGPDGVLLRLELSTCGADMAALAQTVRDNLDAIAARGGKANLVIGQGINLPSSWLADCETWTLTDPRFSGDLCVPWDENYQSRLRDAFRDHLGPATRGHPALASVYFTITTMTNGSEFHFRVLQSSVPNYPGDTVFRQSYFDVMDLFQTYFDVPIVFEGGHCVWMDPPGGATEPVDCELPLLLYRHARDTWRADKTGVALWNCAERFWASPGGGGDGVRPLLEEAASDGVSVGCQTVGSFTQGACRFTDAAVGDYGDRTGLSGDVCAASASFDPAAACADTVGWFAGQASQNPSSPVLSGTWGEFWSRDLASTGVYQTEPTCAAAMDLLAP